MNILAFFAGILPLFATGTLIVMALEGASPVLTKTERLALGFLLGTTGGMFILFLLGVFGLPFSRLTIGSLLMGILVIAWLLYRWKGRSSCADVWVASAPMSMRMKTVCGVIGALCVAKIAFLAVTFMLTPSYLDDTLSNWNLRAKVFFYEQRFTLELPQGTNPELSSYPPAVSLLKTTLVTIAGEWSEPLVNSVHILWYLAVLTLLFSALRRFLPLSWSLLGLYIFVGLPLPLLHGTNAYAEMFVAAHILAALILLLAAARSDGKDAAALLRIAALFGALLAFTKNEGFLLYGGAFAVLYGWMIVRAQPAMRRRAVIDGIIAAAVIILPWLLFKWSNDLSFGNAKSITGLLLSFEPLVLHALWINLFFEGNWLLLFPLFLVVVFLERKTALQWPVSLLSAFLTLTFFGQMALYLFTSLSIEALKQTGLSRGMVQLSPVIVLLTILLLYQAVKRREEDA